MVKDETGLFLKRFADRMPPGKLEESRARQKLENKHHVYDAEIDEVLYECPPENLWAFRPEGPDPEGVDLWYVVGETGAGRVIWIAGRMGNDGLFRSVTGRGIDPPANNDRQMLNDYRHLGRERDGGKITYEARHHEAD